MAKSKILDAQYWDKRYQNHETPWSIGSVSPALSGYLQLLKNKEQKILIPGAGYAFEAYWLFKQGFKNVFVLDFAPTALNSFRKAHPDFPQAQLIEANFFDHQEQYDLIIEQTFFCALDPALRNKYAQHMHQLLKPGGHLIGLLFHFPLTSEGPPFGGSESEYQELFRPLFDIYRLEPCYNSIKPRAGRELFIHLIAK